MASWYYWQPEIDTQESGFCPHILEEDPPKAKPSPVAGGYPVSFNRTGTLCRFDNETRICPRHKRNVGQPVRALEHLYPETLSTFCKHWQKKTFKTSLNPKPSTP